jgi:hypothetical protein
MESESKNIIQMLKNVKQIIDVSKERGCWTSEELPNINITYHNVCEIEKQLQERAKELQRFEGIAEDPVLEEPEPESEEPMEEVN